jgi:hypothetical protein
MMIITIRSMMKSKLLLVKLAISSSVIKNTDNMITRIFRGLYIANKTSSLIFIYYHYFLLKPWVQDASEARTFDQCGYCLRNLIIEQ